MIGVVYSSSSFCGQSDFPATCKSIDFKHFFILHTEHFDSLDSFDSLDKKETSKINSHVKSFFEKPLKEIK